MGTAFVVAMFEMMLSKEEDIPEDQREHRRMMREQFSWLVSGGHDARDDLFNAYDWACSEKGQYLLKHPAFESCLGNKNLFFFFGRNIFFETLDDEIMNDENCAEFAHELEKASEKKEYKDLFDAWTDARAQKKVAREEEDRVGNQGIDEVRWYRGVWFLLVVLLLHAIRKKKRLRLVVLGCIALVLCSDPFETRGTIPQSSTLLQIPFVNVFLMIVGTLLASAIELSSAALELAGYLSGWYTLLIVLPTLFWAKAGNMSVRSSNAAFLVAFLLHLSAEDADSSSETDESIRFEARMWSSICLVVMGYIFWEKVISTFRLIFGRFGRSLRYAAKRFLRARREDEEAVATILKAAAGGLSDRDIFEGMWKRIWFGPRRRVEELDLSGCAELKHLPSSISDLRCLSTLNLQDCKKLVTLPPEIAELSSVLVDINVEGCENLRIPPSHAQTDLSTILSFMADLRLLRDQPTKVLNKIREDRSLLFAAVLDGAYAESLGQLVKIDPNLVNVTDSHLRKALDVACPECSDEMRAALRFFGRYDLGDEPTYESATCKVFFATDHKLEKPVALKLTGARDRFREEVDSLEQCSDERYVVTKLDHHDDDDFRIEAEQKGLPRYCIVLEQGDRNLREAVQAEFFAGNVTRVRPILEDLARGLQHLHRCGYIHGDFNPANALREKSRRMWQLTDFDASVPIGEYLGAKFTPAYSPPEMVKLIDPATGRPSPLLLANGDVPKINGRLEAQASFDTWSFGAVMFFLLAGEPLIAGADVRGNLNNKGLRQLQKWDDACLEDKLELIQDRHAKTLLKTLLHHDPTERPSITEVLNDAFFNLERQLQGLEMDLEEAKKKLEEARQKNAESKALVELIKSLESQINSLKSDMKVGLDTLGDMKNGLDTLGSKMEDLTDRVSNIPDFIMQVENINCPYVFDFVSEQEFKRQKESAASESAEGPIATVERATTWLEKARSYAASLVSDSAIEAAAKLGWDAVIEEKTMYLQLLCGLTFTPIVSYKVTRKEYPDKIRKFAKIGATLCGHGVKVAWLWNAGAGLVRCFGYPAPAIPVDKLEKLETVMKEIDESKSIDQVADELNSKKDNGFNHEELDEFVEFIANLERSGKMRQRFNSYDKKELKGKSWNGALVKQTCEIDGRTQVTFVSCRETEKIGGRQNFPGHNGS